MWNPGGINSSAVNVSPGVSTTYTVIVTDDNGCSGELTVAVNVNQLPIIDAGNNTTIISGSSTILNGSGGSAYLWSPFSSLSCETCSNPIASPINHMVYYVTGWDSNYCQNIDSVIIDIESICIDPFIPNAFSPNGDDQNDVLSLTGNLCISGNFKFEIFDRWGHTVYESDNINEKWNGKLNQKELDPGVFIYKLFYTDMNGRQQKFKGNISLVK
jgi:gliding motility-associated-like protein